MPVREKSWFLTSYAEEYKSKIVILGEATNPKHLQTYVLDWIDSNKRNIYTGTILLDDFKDKFEGWSEIMFDTLEKRVRKAAKSFLKDRGIYILNVTTRTSIPKQLHELLQMEELPKWPENEIKEIIATNPKFVIPQMSSCARSARSLTVSWTRTRRCTATRRCAGSGG
jgi:hypothetical protein